VSENRLDWEFTRDHLWIAKSNAFQVLRERWIIGVRYDGLFSLMFSDNELLNTTEPGKSFPTFAEAQAYCEEKERLLLVAQESAVGE